MKLNRTNRLAKFPVAPESAATGIWYLDIVHDRLYLSDDAFRIFGISKSGFLPYFGAFCHAIIHPGDLATWTDHWSRFIKDTGPLVIDHRIVLFNREVRHVHQRLERIAAIKSHRTWVKGSVRDLSGGTDRICCERPVA